MRVLLVKMSSLGDVLHTLPAVSDAAAALPGIRFDWVVEEAFAEVPAWHPAVGEVLPVALRRWRRRPLKSWRGTEWRAARAALGARRYDAVIDAQGLLKSAFLLRYTRGTRCGMDRHSVREFAASAAYQRAIAVPRDMHAVDRLRLLFARALAYPLPSSAPDYGLCQGLHQGLNSRLNKGLCEGSGAVPRADLAEALRPVPGDAENSLFFLHGSAQPRKHWPPHHWIELAQLAAAAGYRILLPWGDAAERERAAQIARAAPAGAAQLLPALSLSQLAARLQRATAAVAVDTGLGHLCAALGVPAVSLYGPTCSALVGTRGARQLHLRAPGDTAMAALAPARVWRALSLKGSE